MPGRVSTKAPAAALLAGALLGGLTLAPTTPAHSTGTHTRATAEAGPEIVVKRVKVNDARAYFGQEGGESFQVEIKMEGMAWADVQGVDAELVVGDTNHGLVRVLAPETIPTGARLPWDAPTYGLGAGSIVSLRFHYYDENGALTFTDIDVADDFDILAYREFRKTKIFRPDGSSRVRFHAAKLRGYSLEENRTVLLTNHPVKIYRLDTSKPRHKWRLIATVTTDSRGRLRAAVKSRPGYFKAWIPETATTAYESFATDTTEDEV